MGNAGLLVGDRVLRAGDDDEGFGGGDPGDGSSAGREKAGGSADPLAVVNTAVSGILTRGDMDLLTNVRSIFYPDTHMSGITSKSLLEQSLALTIQELEALRAERAGMEIDYRTRVEPLEQRIASLDSVAHHQRLALHAFETDTNATLETGTRQPLFAVGGARLTDVLESILLEAGKPMHYTTLAAEAIRMGVAMTAKDPGAFVINYLRREPDRFCRTATAGEYALLSWDLPGSRRMDEPKATVKSTKARPRRKSRATRGSVRK